MLIPRLRMWLTLCVCCARCPLCWTAGTVQRQAALWREARCIRVLVMESQPWGCGKMGSEYALCAFGGGAHGVSAALNAPTRWNPAHHGRGIRSRCQVPTASPMWPPYLAARATFVPELCSAGSLFPTSGPRGPSVPSHAPPFHTHRHDCMPLILVRCIGYMGVCSDSGELPPREGKKPSKRNCRLQSFCNSCNRSQTRPILGQV